MELQAPQSQDRTTFPDLLHMGGFEPLLSLKSTTYSSAECTASYDLCIQTVDYQRMIRRREIHLLKDELINSPKKKYVICRHILSEILFFALAHPTEMCSPFLSWK